MDFIFTVVFFFNIVEAEHAFSAGLSMFRFRHLYQFFPDDWFDAFSSPPEPPPPPRHWVARLESALGARRSRSFCMQKFLHVFTKNKNPDKLWQWVFCLRFPPQPKFWALCFDCRRPLSVSSGSSLVCDNSCWFERVLTLTKNSTKWWVIIPTNAC